MKQVAGEPVRKVERRMRDAAKREAKLNARLRTFEGAAKCRSVAVVGLPFASQHAQSGAGVAERAGDPDVVAGLRGIASQRELGRHAAEYCHAQVERTSGGIAADQFAIVALSEFKEAAAKGRKPLFARLRQRERERERLRLAPIAARSERFTAKALWPSACGSISGKK